MIHQIWLGGPVPAQVEAWMKTWQHHHPGWEHRLWTDDDLHWLRLRSQFEASPQYAIKADIARLEILQRYGGLYVDADVEAHRSIDNLVGDAVLILLSEGDLITNAFIGARPQDPTVEEALRLMTRLPETSFSVSEWTLPDTGPLLMTRAAVRSGKLFLPSTRLLAPETACLPRSRMPEIVELARRRRWMTHHAQATWRDQRSLAMRLKNTKLRTRLRRFMDLSES